MTDTTNINVQSQPLIHDATLRTHKDILYWFSGIKVWHLEDDFYIIRNFTPAHLTCSVLQTPLILTFFCTSGSIQGDIDGKHFTLRANEALLTLPLQTMRLHYISPDLCCTLTAMSRSYAEEQNVGEEYMLYENILKKPVLVFSDEQMRANIAMTEMYTYIVQQRHHPHQRKILITLLKANHLMHAMSLHNADAPDTAMERTGALAVRFNRLLEENYIRQHHIAFYATRLAVTPKYLSTAVMQASGHTAGWWIDYYLMRDAERYLTDTRLTVQAIADLLGFANQSSFGKYFRRQRGVSPANYRTQYTNKNHNDNETDN